MRSFLRHISEFRTNYIIILVVILVAFFAVFYYRSFLFVTEDSGRNVPPRVEISVATTTEVYPVTMAESAPGELRIPRLNMAVAFVAPLGVDNRGEIEVPRVFDRVGWYKYSPTPGELGPSIILGHVDSKDGPAVFYDLNKLVAGDEIIIEREDGSLATFVVEKKEEYSQSNFPSESVYGNIDHAGLRLVTCAGVYDRGIERYSHNLVVYARLASVTSASE